MKYDCEITEDFIHERNRLCAFYSKEIENVCKKCPLHDIQTGCISDFLDDNYIQINIVQKWSDTHPIAMVIDNHKMINKALKEIES